MKTDKIYLLHILESINLIEKYSQGLTYAEFLKNPMIQDAILRRLEVIGEAVKKLSDDLKKKYPEIPWRDIAGMRDKLIHHYFGVDLKIVWNTIKKDIPQLKEWILRILKDLESKDCYFQG